MKQFHICDFFHFQYKKLKKKELILNYFLKNPKSFKGKGELKLTVL